jgi:hypothetical protein
LAGRVDDLKSFLWQAKQASQADSAFSRMAHQHAAVRPADAFTPILQRSSHQV